MVEPMSQQPSAELRAWVADVAGPGTPTFGDPLAGATTATVWPAEIADRSLVVKVYDLENDWPPRDDVGRDAAAMRAAEEIGLAAPRVVAVDPDGDRLGVPAIIMTRLAGQARAHGQPDPEAWVDGLADTLIEIARAGRPTSALPLYQHWYRLPVAVPSWTTDAGPWRALNEVLESNPPDGALRFIHRDFHPLNVLWNDGRPSGVVDWVNGCLGPIQSDIATCRINIALADDRQDGHTLADRFLQRCLAAELPWHPIWDLDWIAGTSRLDPFLSGVDLGAEMSLTGIQRVLERSVIDALAAVEAWPG